MTLARTVIRELMTLNKSFHSVIMWTQNLVTLSFFFNFAQSETVQGLFEAVFISDDSWIATGPSGGGYVHACSTFEWSII